MISILAFDSLDFAGHEDDAPRLIATRVDAALVDAKVGAMLAVLSVWLRFRRWLRKLFARG